MKFLLDTDHISILQRRTGSEFATLSARMARHSPSEFAYCIVSCHEQMLGCHTYLSRARTTADLVHGLGLMSRVLQDFRAAVVLPFDAAAAQVLDGLVASRVRLATMDLRIASIALARGLTLLTRNMRDFRRVPGLVAEDWTL